MRTYAVIDFETTGLRAGADRIIEVGAVLVDDGRIVGTFDELMDPGFRLPPFITSLTGITDAMLRGRPRPEAAMPRLRAFLGDHVCIAHNAGFDQRFFDAEMALAGEAHPRAFLCSMLLSRRLLPEAGSHKLGALAQQLGLGVPEGMRAHRALADALVTVGLWQHLLGVVRERMPGRAPDSETLARICRTAKSQLPRLFTALAQAPAADAYRAAAGPAMSARPR